MQWARENLPSSFYYSSADDDMMVDVAALDDVIMKAVSAASHLYYFPILCIFAVVSGLNCIKNFYLKMNEIYKVNKKHDKLY